MFQREGLALGTQLVSGDGMSRLDVDHDTTPRGTITEKQRNEREMKK